MCVSKAGPYVSPCYRNPVSPPSLTERRANNCLMEAQSNRHSVCVCVCVRACVCVCVRQANGSPVCTRLLCSDTQHTCGSAHARDSIIFLQQNE